MAKYPILDLFYKGKQWQSFRTAYIAERLKSDKGNRCDWCGEWIDKPEDITLHHIEELTPDNVNDATIALNPDNIKQVHPACHNQIHKHAASKGKRVFLVYGPPLAGMQKYIKQRTWPGDIIVDIDSIYEAITGMKRYEKPDGLFQNAAAIQSLLIDQVKTRLGRWDNAWIVGGYPDKYKRDRIVKETGAEVIYIQATREECISRLKMDPERSKKEKEWTKYIDKWFDKHTE